MPHCDYEDIMPHRDYEDLGVMQEWWDGREARFQVRRFVCLSVCALAYLLKEGAVRELSSIFPSGFQCPPVWKSLPSSLPEVR